MPPTSVTAGCAAGSGVDRRHVMPPAGQAGHLGALRVHSDDLQSRAFGL